MSTRASFQYTVLDTFSPDSEMGVEVDSSKTFLETSSQFKGL